MQGGLNKRNVIGKNKEIQKLEADAAHVGFDCKVKKIFYH